MAAGFTLLRSRHAGNEAHLVTAGPRSPRMGRRRRDIARRRGERKVGVGFAPGVAPHRGDGSGKGGYLFVLPQFDQPVLGAAVGSHRARMD